MREVKDSPRTTRFAFLPFVAACFLSPIQAGAAEISPRPGAVVQVDVEGLLHPVSVYVPEDHTPARVWPALFHFHGTNGKPSIEFFRRLTHGRGFVIVGMSYRESGTMQYRESYIAEELATLNAVATRLEAPLRLDPGRRYVSGFSKGGWMAGLLLERAPWLRGGLVMGAGRYDRQERKATPFKHKPWILVGIGQLDGNYAMSLNAREQWETLGARVIFDEWDDTAHRYPATEEQWLFLRQWLAIAAAGPDDHALQATAKAWVREERAHIAGMEALPAYLRLERLFQSPFARLLGPETEAELAKDIAERRRTPKLAEEWAIEQALLEAFKRERLNRYLSTLRQANTTYGELADRHERCHFGEVARRHQRRTGTMLPSGR